MMRSLWIAKTGMDAMQMNVDATSHNLANVSTNGYKRERVVFEDLLYQNLRQPGGATSQQTQMPTGLQLGTGARAVATVKNFSQGNLQLTDGPLDLAIQGDGFFQITLPPADEPSPAGAFAYNTILVNIRKTDLVHRPGWDELSAARSHVFRRDQ